MALHVTSINGMGGSILSGSSILNYGMDAGDHMHISEDLINDAGVLRFEDFKVIQNTPTGRTVRVTPGIAYVSNPAYTVNSITQTRFWRVKMDADTVINLTPNNNANPRITAIFLRVNTSVTPDYNASNVADIIAIDGTPASSPVAPNPPSDNNGYLRLANVLCNSNYSSVTDANITDTRAQVGAYNVVYSGRGLIFNGRVSASVGTFGGSNGLKVDLVTSTGGTPSKQNPIIFIDNNGIKRYITTPLSITVNSSAGSTFGVSASRLLPSTGTNLIDLFVFLVYLGDNFALGLSRLNYSRCETSGYTTTTNESKYLACDASISGRSLLTIARIRLTVNTAGDYTTVDRIDHGDVFYSNRWNSYNPNLTADSGTVSGITVTNARFYVMNEICFLSLRLDNINLSGSLPNFLRITLPFRSAFYTEIPAHMGFVGSDTRGVGRFVISSNSNQGQLYRQDGNNFETINNFWININGFYLI